MFRGIKRNVLVLGVTSLLTDLSSEIIYPLVPLFLTSVLGAPVAVVGLIEGIAESTASLLKVFSGWISDRRPRRRPLVICGYSISAVAKPLMATAFTWPAVLLLRFSDRVGKGIRTAPRDALIADSSAPATRGRAFGFHRAMDTVGAALGALLALLAVGVLGERYRLIFLLSAIPAALGVASLFFVHERRRHLASSGPARLSLSQFGRRYKIFLLAGAIFALGNSSDAFLILRARDLGLSAFAVVLAYVVFNLVYAALSMPAGSLSDRIGRRRLLVAGFSLFSLVYLGLALASGTVAVWPLFAVYGIYMAMTEGVGKAYVTDLSPAGTRGTALGAYQTVTGIVAFFSSLIAGLLWDLVDPRAPFLFGAAAGLAAALVLVAAVRDRPSGGGGKGFHPQPHNCTPGI
ncbi:MAG TPA: MFS transporter [Actinobacteria bacterium]|nr:MFS transporter [Actinomycetota bacterium]